MSMAAQSTASRYGKSLAGCMHAARVNSEERIHRSPMHAPVLVLTASAHRQAAFEAAEFLMDYLKANAPFWKSEERKGASGDKNWVEAKAQDDSAAARWKE